MGKILCFGEILLRISLDKEEKWLEKQRFPFFIGGAELNVARALALWELPTVYFSALPQNVLGDALLRKLKSFQIECNRVQRSGEKVGLYYLSEGSDLKSATVVYDRAHSAFSGLSMEKVDWDMLFDQVSFFHFSAICPPLSTNTMKLCTKTVKEAEKRGIRISIDLNYRKALWGDRSDVVETMDSLLKSCHIVMGNIWAANSLLGIPLEISSLQKGTKKDFLDAAEKSARAIQIKYPQVYLVANTFRFKTEAGIHYYSSLHPNKNQYISHSLFHSSDLTQSYNGQSLQENFVSNEYFSTTIVDGVGSGDCYMAGLLYGLYHSWPMQKIVDFASAAAFTKLSVPGDATNMRVEEINQFIASKNDIYKK